MPIGQDSGRLCFGLLGLVEMDFPVTSMCEVGEYVAIHDGVGAGLVRCAKLTGNDVECGRRGTKNRGAHLRHQLSHAGDVEAVAVVVNRGSRHTGLDELDSSTVDDLVVG